METVETIIVGGGQAGLSTSYHLKQLGSEHVVFEQASEPGNAWRNGRWDSFTLVTPNWAIQLPGANYDGNDPDGFLPKDEIISYFERYVERFDLPVQFNTAVQEVTPVDHGRGYRVKTGDKTYEARNVVMATGSYQKPKIPAFSAGISGDILQLHSGKYRNPDQMPDGAVLVVGAAQSGLQITEELYQHGRVVYLCTCSAPRMPRRYRGRDTFAWLVDSGFMDQIADQLPSPKARLAGNPQVSGKNGGHSLSLHQFAHDGVRLLGHIADARDNQVMALPDLKENLARGDKVEQDITVLIDRYIETNGIDAPPETLPDRRDGYATPEITKLDLKAAKIHTVIWAMGYTADYSLLKLPLTDEDGFPIQRRGQTSHKGLYFIGTHWLYKRKSALLIGVNEDVEHLVSQLTGE